VANPGHLENCYNSMVNGMVNVDLYSAIITKVSNALVWVCVWGCVFVYMCVWFLGSLSWQCVTGPSYHFISALIVARPLASVLCLTALHAWHACSAVVYILSTLCTHTSAVSWLSVHGWLAGHYALRSVSSHCARARLISLGLSAIDW